MSMKYYAHSLEGELPREWQLLEEHLHLHDVINFAMTPIFLKTETTGEPEKLIPALSGGVM